MSKKPETFGSAQGETKFIAPEGSELSRLYAKLEAQATLLSLTQASAAAMRSAIATAQRALDQYVILYDRTALASEAETAMREAVKDSSLNHRRGVTRDRQ